MSSEPITPPASEEEVRTLQQALVEAGYSVGGVDGKAPLRACEDNSRGRCSYFDKLSMSGNLELFLCVFFARPEPVEGRPSISREPYVSAHSP